MTFLWPGFLFLLLLIPVLIAAYILILRRRRRSGIRFSSLALVRDAIPKQSLWRRHLPFALFLLALAGLIAALARPVAIISVPVDQTTIVLTIDVSRSMCSTDVKPTRLQAAEAAALSFVQRQKGGTQIGLVAFSTFAELIQPPTTDQEMLQTAIESLTVGSRTAIGSAILKAIDAIAEMDKNVPASVDPATGVEPTPVPKGAYVPDIIILLTDGASNTGPLPTDAAQQAVDRGIRIYTIGFGTPNGSEFASCQSSDPFGGFGGFGGRQPGVAPPFGFNGFGSGFGGFRRGIDEATLKQIASMTGGQYYSASSAGELQNVFRSLPTYLIARHETTEISVFFTAIGAALVLLAMWLALRWHPLS